MWGGTAVAGKLVIQDVPPITAGPLRYGLTAVLVMLLFRRQPPHPRFASYQRALDAALGGNLRNVSEPPLLPRPVVRPGGPRRHHSLDHEPHLDDVPGRPTQTGAHHRLAGRRRDPVPDRRRPRGASRAPARERWEGHRFRRCLVPSGGRRAASNTGRSLLGLIDNRAPGLQTYPLGLSLAFSKAVPPFLGTLSIPISRGGQPADFTSKRDYRTQRHKAPKRRIYDTLLRGLLSRPRQAALMRDADPVSHPGVVERRFVAHQRRLPFGGAIDTDYLHGLSLM